MTMNPVISIERKKNIDNSLCFAVFPSISYSVEDEI